MGKTKQYIQAVPKRSCKLNFVAKVTQTGQKWPRLDQTGQDNLGENNWSQNVVCQYWPRNSAKPTCLGHLVYSHHSLIEKTIFNSGSRNNGSACPYPPPHCLGSQKLWENFFWGKTLASIFQAKCGSECPIWVASSWLGNLPLFVIQHLVKRPNWEVQSSCF